MSYALGIRVDEGIVLAADGRTNAGVDQVSTFKKLHVFEKPGEKIIALAVIGNLSLAQSLLTELRGSERGARTKPRQSEILEAGSMLEAARLIGQTIRGLESTDGAALARHNVAFDITVIAAGQIGKERPRLFLVYPAGNFIEASDDAPYFQIGERKYGKSILDLGVSEGAPLSNAVKSALLSCDVTLQNNATVGLPVDLLVFKRDAWRPQLLRRFGPYDPYWAELKRRWGSGAKKLFTELPELSEFEGRDAKDRSR
jgi:putative proteasome-type protease